MPQAVADHRRHRAAPYAGCVGPLLVRAGDAAATAALLHQHERLEVSLVVRPGSDPGTLPTAVDQLQREGRAVVRGLELPVADPITLRPLLDLRVPLWLEVSRGRLQQDLDAVTAAGAHAKLRTGGLAQDDVPPAALLAELVVGSVSRSLRFKLTAGLHHAVRAVDPTTGLDQHGVANVLVATALATAGAPVDDVRAVLDERDGAVLRQAVAALSAADVDRLRGSFASFGCCGVTDPLSELGVLLEDLLPSTHLELT
ncbi:hypothetical protein GCM10023145_30440 [Angustibacter luteus]